MSRREAGSNNQTLMHQLRQLPHALRPGAILGLAVASVVGVVGLVQWDQRLMLIGLGAGIAIVATNVVVVVVRHWHQSNTDPTVTYPTAEDVVRLRSPRR